MAATFSWVQYTGSGANSTTPGGSGTTGTSSAAAMSWDFETADSTGTQSYTANPVSAGSASYPVWLKGYFTNGTQYTITNVKFWQFVPANSSANTATFTIYGTTNAQYSIATGTATSSNYASNVTVATNGTNSTASPAGALTNIAGFATNAAATGVLGSYICLQLSAGTGAPAGTSGYFGFTLQYDEQ